MELSTRFQNVFNVFFISSLFFFFNITTALVRSTSSPLTLMSLDLPRRALILLAALLLRRAARVRATTRAERPSAAATAPCAPVP